MSGASQARRRRSSGSRSGLGLQNRSSNSIEARRRNGVACPIGVSRKTDVSERIDVSYKKKLSVSGRAAAPRDPEVQPLLWAGKKGMT
jgi:hypothetical protein